MAIPLSSSASQAVIAVGNATAARFPRAWSKCHINETDPERYDFIILFARAALADPTILQTHRAGMNGKGKDPKNPSMDVLAFVANGVTDLTDVTSADVVGGAGGPDPKIVYQDITQPSPPGIGAIWIDPHTKQTHYPYDDGPIPTHDTALGCSLFYLPRAFKENWPELRPNLDWIAHTLHADYIRAFWSIGALQNPDDVWIHAGSSYLWPDLVHVCRDAQAMVWRDYGLRVQWTITGGPEGFETDADLATQCGRFLDTIRGVPLEQLELVECMNEYAVNSGSADAGRHILRNMARTLAPHLGGLRLSLSSPNSCMGGDPTDPAIGAEVSKMYDGLPSQTNAATPHWSRHSGHPEWHAPPDLGPSTPAYVYGNEGEGPGSSVVEERDANTIGGHYQAAIGEGYAGWLLHSDCGIWSTRIPNHYKIPDGTGAIPRGQWQYFRDMPNAAAIAAVLAEIRKTGSGGGGNGGGGGPLPGPSMDKLLCGEYRAPGIALISPNKKASLQNQLDGNLVSYADTGDGQGNHPVWASNTPQPPGYQPGNLKMQEDGNLVLSNAAGQPIWASNTAGHPGAMIQVQDDGYVVMYVSGTPIWRVPA